MFEDFNDLIMQRLHKFFK